MANAERYYRSMYRGRASSWNLRDSHMVETLDVGGASFYGRDGGRAWCVWAHNSHLGDARATQMGKGGELNVGQLVRQRHGDACCLVGFTTYTGDRVRCRCGLGRDRAERRAVRPWPVRECGSRYSTGLAMQNFLVDLREPRAREALSAPLLERAIGVIYRPETERMSHYFAADLPRQFDVMVHVDETRAVEPLEPTPDWHAGEHELAETYPFAL